MECTFMNSKKASGDYQPFVLELESSTDGIVEYHMDTFDDQLKGDLMLSKYTTDRNPGVSNDFARRGSVPVKLGGSRLHTHYVEEGPPKVTGFIQNFVWFENASHIVLGTGVKPTIQFDVGVTEIGLTVADNTRDTQTDFTRVVIKSPITDGAYCYLPTRYMRAYARAEHAPLRAYVDEQEAHCDDIGLNIVALSEGRKPPLRVLLPKRSVVDFYSECWPRSRMLTGGLGLQKGRGQRRSECVKELMRMYGLKRFKNAAHTATCLARGTAVAKEEYIHPERYGRMKESHVECDQDAER